VKPNKVGPNHRDTEVVARVARYFGIPVAELTGPSRVRSVTYARHIAMWLLHDLCPECAHGRGISFRGLGRIFDRSDRAVRFAVRRIEAERAAGNWETVHDVAALSEAA